MLRFVHHRGPGEGPGTWEETGWYAQSWDEVGLDWEHGPYPTEAAARAAFA